MEFSFVYCETYNIGNFQFFLHRIAFESVSSKRISYLQTSRSSRVEGRNCKRISRKLRAQEIHLFVLLIQTWRFDYFCDDLDGPSSPQIEVCLSGTKHVEIVCWSLVECTAAWFDCTYEHGRWEFNFVCYEISASVVWILAETRIDYDIRGAL